MKAVILAGGKGERLRPLTDKMPKPLVPILNRPVMDYTLALLSNYGINEAVVTTCYLADKIKKTYGDGKFGVKLCFAEEKTPLGTCGGVKACEKFFSNSDSDFLVISGDAICDFDLGKAIDFHRQKNALATIILTSVTRPLEYGVVLSDEFGKIRAFSEKPDWSEALSDYVNSGVYILSKEIFSYIPENEKYDFSKDLFPKLLKSGKKIFGYKDDGYWCDIGKIPEYYRCNLDLLNEKFESHMTLSGKIKESEGGRYFVSDTAKVSDTAVINENTVISDRVTVGDGAFVSGSILMQDSRISDGAKIVDAILCDNVKVGEKATVTGDAVLGDGSVVDENGSVLGGRHSAGSSFIKSPAFEKTNEFEFTENGIEFNSEFLVEEKCEVLGKAFGSVFGTDIIVMFDRDKSDSEYFANVFSLGVLKSGKNVLDAGKGDREMTSFLAMKFSLPSVFVSSAMGRAKIFGFEKDSLPLLRESTVSISKFSSDKTISRFGKRKTILNAEELYKDALRSCMGEGNSHVFGFFGSKRAEILLSAAIKSGYNSYNEKTKGLCSISVFGDEVEVFLGNERLFDTPRATLFVIKEKLKEGKRKFFLPENSPTCFTDEIVKSNGEVHLFSLSHTRLDSSEKRNAAMKERWTFDSLFLAAEILKYISRLPKNEFLDRVEHVPQLFVSTLSFYPDSATRLKLIGRIIEDGEADNIKIVPLYHTIKIISEASSFEAALDNAFEYRGKLNDIEQEIKGS